MAISAKQAIEAVPGTRGIIHSIASRLGCTSRHVYNLMDKYSTFKEAVEQEREDARDFVESKLFKLIEDENVAAILFYAKTQLRHRGYVERQEIEHSGGIDVHSTYESAANEFERLVNKQATARTENSVAELTDTGTESGA